MQESYYLTLARRSQSMRAPKFREHVSQIPRNLVVIVCRRADTAR